MEVCNEEHAENKLLWGNKTCRSTYGCTV